MTPAPLLHVDHLDIAIKHDKQTSLLVEDVSFAVRPGEIFALVGESGSGKSISVLSIMGLLDDHFTFPKGAIHFETHDLLTLPKSALRKLRGSQIAMIFQEPMTSLNPVYTIGSQITEILRTHQTLSKQEALTEAAELLTRVGIPDPHKRLHDYPHQLSGGMRQRVMIAIAISCKPKLLIADEPTTALDVTIQRQILDVLLALKNTYGMAIILITHDLGVAAETADHIGVMYAGKMVEVAPVTSLFANPKHPYTQGLIQCIPRLDTPDQAELLTIKGTVPLPHERHSGCCFENRCPIKKPICAQTFPNPTTLSKGHHVYCWEYEDQ